MKRYGRTWRRRSRRKACAAKKQITKPMVLLQPEYLALLRWAKQNGVNFGNLKPTVFSNTGRGMAATNRIKTQDCIISVPEKLLITIETVMNSTLGQYLKSVRQFDTPQSRPLSKYFMCIYLLYERYCMDNSFWFPYIKTLPKGFNTPCYFSEEELTFLPKSCKQQCGDQVSRLQEAYDVMQRTFSKVMQQYDVRFWSTVNFDSFKWAWCVLNTRSVYLSSEGHPGCGPGRGPGSGPGAADGSCALAPVLDLLNHSDTAEMCGRYNFKSRRYEINTVTEYSRGDQVFISYGPHDNTTLLQEYGFILPKNIHNSYKFHISAVLSITGRTKYSLSKAKREIIQRNGFEKDLSCVEGYGVSWNLRTVLAIMALPEIEMCNWDIVLSGKCTSEGHQSQVDKWIKDLLQNELKELELGIQWVKRKLTNVDYLSDNISMALQLRQQEKCLLENALHQVASS